MNGYVGRLSAREALEGIQLAITPIFLEGENGLANTGLYYPVLSYSGEELTGDKADVFFGEIPFEELGVEIGRRLSSSPAIVSRGYGNAKGLPSELILRVGNEKGPRIEYRARREILRPRLLRAQFYDFPSALGPSEIAVYRAPEEMGAETPFGAFGAKEGKVNIPATIWNLAQYAKDPLVGPKGYKDLSELVVAKER